MKIVDVRTTRIRTPLQRPFVTAVRRADAVESVIVQVRDADGRCGWGEAAHNPRVTGETTASIEAAVDAALRPAVLGRAALDLVDTGRAIAGALAGNSSAKSAVDCAVHDLAARQLGVPLHVLLGGVGGQVRTDVTLSVGPAEQLAAEVATRREQGFDVVKIKLDGTDDVERVRKVAVAAGPDVRLRIDANQAWTPRDAVAVIAELEDAGLPLEFVEQPVAGADVAGLAWVTARVRTPVLADEAVRTAADVVTIARHRAADLVNLKLAKCGGLSAARDFVATARACGFGVIFGSMMETHVGCGAAAALAAALGDPAGVTDLDPPYLLQRAPVVGGMRFDGPRITLPETPGLGITDLVPTPA